MSKKYSARMFEAETKFVNIKKIESYGPHSKY